jgi:hypothetical protein
MMRGLTEVERITMQRVSNGICEKSIPFEKMSAQEITAIDRLEAAGRVVAIPCDKYKWTHRHITPLGRLAITCYEAATREYAL